jgi:flavorubredoxin
MISTYKAVPDIDVLTSDFPVPGFGLVPINAFVWHGREPILVDTGSVINSAEFLPALRGVINPADLRWIWLTHTDFDHIGALTQLLEENSQLRVITTFLSVGIMTLSSPLPLDRVRIVNPGQKITLADRTLSAIRPPVFDNPATSGFYDESSRVLVSSDCFGALLSAVPHSAMDLTDEELRQGQVFWATVDSPWIHNTDTVKLERKLEAIRAMEPDMILSSHLPAAPGSLTARMLASLRAAPGAQPFTGLDQAGLEQVLAQMTGDAVHA